MPEFLILCDSIVVIRADSLMALGHVPVQVVLTTGYQDMHACRRSLSFCHQTFITPPTCQVERWLSAAT